MTRKLVIIISVVLTFGTMMVGNSRGSNYPTKPVEIVVTYGPGGTSDLVVRLMAEIAKKYFKEPFPTSTLVQITGFVHPDALIEINAVAVL